MARQLRIEYPNAFYHVMNRGAGRKPIFHNEQFYNLFLELLANLKRSFGVEIHAYCLMGNHYHLLLKTPHANLSKAMKHLNGVYTLRHNRLLQQDGPLFRGRFKAILVDADNYFLHVSRYIHLNPIEANLVKNPEKYLWSSYQYYYKKQVKPHWLTLDVILNRFNSKNKNQEYHLFISEGIDPQTLKIYNASKTPPIIGKELFCKKIKDKLKIKPHKEIPATKKLPHQFISIEKIVKIIAKHKKCQINDIISGNDKILKKIAIYFCKHLTNHSLNEIGNYFSSITYSAVSQICKRLTIEMGRNKQLKNDIEKIESILSNIKT